MTNNFKSDLTQQQAETLRDQCMTVIAKRLDAGKIDISLKFPELQKKLEEIIPIHGFANSFIDRISAEAVLSETLMASLMSTALDAYLTVVKIRNLKANVVDLEYVMEFYIDISFRNIKEQYLPKAREANINTVDSYNTTYALKFNG